MKKNLLALAFGLVLAVLLVEGLFRVLPVSDSTAVRDVNDANPYMRFEADQSFALSRGKFFEIRARKRTNDLGFFDDTSSGPRAGRRALALIGDSYVEAVQVTNAEAIHGVVQARVGDGLAVLAMGTSGSPLSQYLAYARLAKETLAPAAYAFVVIANDYDESLLRYKSDGGHHYYTDDWQLRRVDYATSLPKRLIRQSATARYFAINLKDHEFRFLPSARGSDDASHVANVRAVVDPERLAWSRKVVGRFLADLRTLVGDAPVFFVVDALRDDIYRGLAPDARPGSFAATMTRHFMDEARAAGHTVLDLHPVFDVDFRQHRQRFEFPTDAHWNARGHRLAGETLAAALARHGLVASQTE